MGRRLFVGRLPLDSTERELIELFSEVGTVTSVSIKFDRATGKQRGFAFVTMDDDENAQAAIRQLSGALLRGKNIRVVEAETRRSGKSERSGNDGGDLDEDAVIKALKSGRVEIPRELWGEIRETKRELDQDEVISAIKSGQIEIPPELWGEVPETKRELDQDEVIQALKSGKIEIPPELWSELEEGRDIAEETSKGLDPDEVLDALKSGRITIPPELLAQAGDAAPRFVVEPRRRWPWVVAAALLGAGVAAAVLLQPSDPPPDPGTVLITRFRVFGQKEGSEYLGYAFAQALAVNLAPIDRLKVLPVPEAVADTEHHATDARRLGAGRLVVGSLTRDKDTIKVSLTLIDSVDSRVLWGVQEQSGDIRHLALLTAADLATKLGVSRPRQYVYVTNLTGGRKMTAAAETGHALGALRRGQFRKALGPTETLVERFPRSAPAAVLRSHALMLQWDADPTQQNLTALRQSLRRITKNDANSPYAKVYQAYLIYREGQPNKAIIRYTRVLSRNDLAPATRAWVLRYRAVAKQDVSKMESALKDLRESQRLDPTNAWTLSILSEALEQSGRFEEALARADQGVALMPSFWRSHMTLGAALASLERWEDAAAAYKRSCDLGRAQWPCALYALNLKKSGKAGAAAKAIAAAVQLTNSAWGKFHLACYFAVAGDRREAIENLRDAIDLGFADPRVGTDADLSSLSGDAAYARLIKEVEQRQRDRNN